ncbi:MAG: ATP-binding protein [Steroidobacteraceae bacterium]|jgi:two-component system sensor kinase FixL|nr:ATP-binding protein [Steroidobacteraceae bacterium]
MAPADRIAGFPWRLAGWVVAYVAAYVALEVLSVFQPVLELGITPWNPQAGLTLAFLLWFGWRFAPWTAVAALLAELVVRESGASVVALSAASASVALGYGTLAWLLRRGGFEAPLASSRDAGRLALGAAITPLLVACAYVTPFVLAGVLPLNESGPTVIRYWVGDLNGIVTVAPLLLGLRTLPATARAVLARRGLAVAQLAMLGGTLWLVFGVEVTEGPRFVYVLFAPAVWITLTWGVPGATLSTLAIQLGLMTAASYGLPAAALVDVQFLLVTLGLTALLLGAVIAERTAALERVAARETEQRALLAAAPDAVLATDARGRIASANPAACRLFGADAARLLGTAPAEWLPQLALDAAPVRARLQARRADGSAVPVEIASVPLEPPATPGHLLLVRDVTEREQAQAQLRDRDTALARAMRFAVAGELATALTHELNQPITALVSYLRAAEILAAPLQERDPRLVETLQKTTREALRAADVLKRLRDFYRTGTARVEAVDLAALVAEVVHGFAERAARAGVALQVDVARGEPVSADRIHLQMVLHNLVANALDATADGRAGHRLTIAGAPLPDRDALALAVEDTGSGIAPEIAAQLFEPFVTSKPDGMGLGLSISRSLMRGQGGELRLERSGPDGSRFVIELPREPRRRAVA